LYFHILARSFFDLPDRLLSSESNIKERALCFQAGINI